MHIHTMEYCCLVVSHVWLFCGPMGCSPLGSSVHGISQARNTGMALSEKGKSKPQWSTITRWSEWLLSKCLQTINAGEGVEKREPSCTVGGNANWYSHYGEQCGDSLKKLGIKPPYDPAIQLLGIYPEEIEIEKDTCNPVSTAALFTIVRTWK